MDVVCDGCGARYTLCPGLGSLNKTWHSVPQDDPQKRHLRWIDYCAACWQKLRDAQADADAVPSANGKRAENGKATDGRD